MYIDSHQHFWKLARGDYSWMSSEYKPLYKDFFPSDLKPLIKAKYAHYNWPGNIRELRNVIERLTAIVVFPTPPLPLVIAKESDIYKILLHIFGKGILISLNY